MENKKEHEIQEVPGMVGAREPVLLILLLLLYVFLFYNVLMFWELERLRRVLTQYTMLSDVLPTIGLHLLHMYSCLFSP